VNAVAVLNPSSSFALQIDLGEQALAAMGRNPLCARGTVEQANLVVQIQAIHKMPFFRRHWVISQKSAKAIRGINWTSRSC
jgi:hypothetical protein